MTDETLNGKKFASRFLDRSSIEQMFGSVPVVMLSPSVAKLSCGAAADRRAAMPSLRAAAVR